MNVYWYNGYSVIEEDFKYQISEDFINKIINGLLKKWGFITKDIERCVRKDNFLIVCPYGPLSHYTLSRTLKKIMTGLDIPYEFHYGLQEDIKNKLSDILPISTNYKNSVSSGSTEDSREIDKNVKDLVDVINMFEGVTTFSSCEGHPPNNNLYVLFHVEKLKHLQELSYYIDKYISKIWNKYNLYEKNYIINLNFEYGKWKHMPGIFFEFSFKYPDDNKDLVFKIVRELSWLIKEALLNEISANF